LSVIAIEGSVPAFFDGYRFALSASGDMGEGEPPGGQIITLRPS
jgi:hypothetical protein